MVGMVQMAKALGDDTRYRILGLVEHRALCVCELAAVLDMPQSTVSSHLRLLHRAEWLEAERCDKWMYYRLAAERQQLWEVLHDCLEIGDEERKLRRDDLLRADACVQQRDCRCGAGPQRMAMAKVTKTSFGRKKNDIA